MPNVPISEKSAPATTPLAQRISACREQLARSTAHAGELHDTASIFGWAYLRPRD